MPEDRVEDVAAALRSGAWSAGRFALEAAVRLADGTVARLVTAERADAELRQKLVAEHLAGFRVRADPRAYQVWWELPGPWRADTFTAAAAARGIAVTPGSAFAAAPGRRGGRFGRRQARTLASVAPPKLARALGTLADVARTRP